MLSRLNSEKSVGNSEVSIWTKQENFENPLVNYGFFLVLVVLYLIWLVSVTLWQGGRSCAKAQRAFAERTKNLSPIIRYFVAISIYAFYQAFLSFKCIRDSHLFVNTHKSYAFCCDFSNMRKNDVCCRELANTRATKKFKTFLRLPIACQLLPPCSMLFVCLVQNIGWI